MLLDRLLRAWAYLTDTAAPGTARRSRLAVEAMEDRAVPAAVPLTAPNGGEWVKIDTISVAVKTNRDAASGVQSNVVLGEGVTYLAVARGTARIAINETGVTDAEYIRYNKSTGPQDGSSPGYAPHNHGVRLAGVDGGTTAGNLWGAYQADHQYVREFVGQGTTVTGYYSDISSQYNDNSGTLEVDLYAAVPTIRALYAGTALTFSASELGLASVGSVSQPSHGSVEVTGATMVYTGDFIDVTDALPESDTLEVTGFAADGSLLTVKVVVVWNSVDDDVPDPQPGPAQPAPNPAFTDIKQVIDQLSKSPDAKKILDGATAAGVKIISGIAGTGGGWSPTANGGKGQISIDPTRTASLDQATGVLLFELLQAKSSAEGIALDKMATAGTISATAYADQKDALTYKYIK